MKKTIALCCLICGLLLTAVPRYILPACEYEGFQAMHCSDTARAEFIAGGILAALGVVIFFLPSRKTLITGALSGLGLFVVSFALPDIFGYCRSSRMPCNYGMVPGIRFVAGLGSLIIIACLFVIFRRNQKRKELYD